jgi:hypothetical protein
MDPLEVTQEIDGQFDLPSGVYQRALVVDSDGQVTEALCRQPQHSQRYANVQPIRLGVRQALA